MRKKTMNLFHHHNLNNQSTGWICPRAMKTVITKHTARNRHDGRKSVKSQAPRKELHSSKSKLLCKYHQKLGTGMILFTMTTRKIPDIKRFR
eukprot:9651096-Ditylum_brightwellii.AAC.1